MKLNRNLLGHSSSAVLALLSAFVFCATPVFAGEDSAHDEQDSDHRVVTKIIQPAPLGDSIFVNGDAEKGQQIAEARQCAQCHGANGNSKIGANPSLADQHAAYIYEELKAFVSVDGEQPPERMNPNMNQQAAALSDSDMRNLAAYYSIQENTASLKGSDDFLEAGLKLYRGGDASREIPACIACHGPLGEGNPGVPYPRLQGLSADYSIKRLKQYRKEALEVGEKETDEQANPMPAISARLSDIEIQALAYTMQGMRQWAQTMVKSPE